MVETIIINPDACMWTLETDQRGKKHPANHLQWCNQNYPVPTQRHTYNCHPEWNWQPTSGTHHHQIYVCQNVWIWVYPPATFSSSIQGSSHPETRECTQRMEVCHAIYIYIYIAQQIGNSILSLIVLCWVLCRFLTLQVILHMFLCQLTLIVWMCSNFVCSVIFLIYEPRQNTC